LAIIGPNGGGKSTLLKLILGLLTPNKGKITIFGDKNRKNINKIGYVPQNSNVNSSFPISVTDVLLMGKLGKTSIKINEDKFLELLKTLDILKFKNKKIGELSGGQRQRVFIARALVSEPEILILDEPLSGIDVDGQRKFYEILTELNKKITIIVVSHDMNFILRYAKSAAVVRETLCYHNAPRLTPEMFKVAFDCPFEIIGSVMSEEFPEQTHNHHICKNCEKIKESENNGTIN